jgi:septum formation protein
MGSAPQQIYLASKSPRRRELLKQVGVHFALLMVREQSLRIDVDETPLPGEKPRDYVQRIVQLKADAAMRVVQARKLPPRPILTADTTVTFNDEIFGKPENVADATRILSILSGQTHEVLTALAVSFAHETHVALSVSHVTFATLSPAEIKRYIDTGEPMDKAGAYAIQGHAAKWIAELRGSYSGVMGLPLHETVVLLKKVGMTV